MAVPRHEKIVYEAILDSNFEDGLSLAVAKANCNDRTDLAPWEVVMAYLIALERRVAKLERKKKEIDVKSKPMKKVPGKGGKGKKGC